jgi:mannose-6-phosphate isomerase-like protein (cupin superfamily)
MPKQGKIWGETEEIFSSRNVCVNHLNILSGGYCSEHRHRAKFNLFFVLHGKLRISILVNDKWDHTIIGPGQKTEVAPGYFHKFQALTDVECLEIYEAYLDREDIERRTIGGVE